MYYRKLGPVTDIEIIAQGAGVDIRAYLNRTFGRGDWRKLKGLAEVEYTNGEIWLVELHWFEAHGIGKRLEKDKVKLRKLK